MPVWRGEPFPHRSSSDTALRGAGRRDPFQERAALRAQLDTGQRLQRAHGDGLFYGLQELQVRDRARSVSRRDSSVRTAPAPGAFSLVLPLTPQPAASHPPQRTLRPLGLDAKVGDLPHQLVMLEALGPHLEVRFCDPFRELL